MRTKYVAYKLIVLLILAITANAQNAKLSMERGLPGECNKCGACPSKAQEMCICFQKLVFQNADIKSIFVFLADTAKVNIVTDPDISIKVTLKLENVSWCQVFSLLLDLYNLRAVEKEGYMHVLTDDKYWSTRFGQIDNITREKSLQEKETRIIKIHNVSAQKTAEVVKTALSSGGELVVDQQSNSLVIRDFPDQFPTIEAMIESLDVLSRQVKISCKILQIDQSSLKDLGIDWSATQTGGDLTASVNMNQVGGAGAGASMGNFTWGIIPGAYELNIRLSAIISKGKGKILDQPHIITMDNIQAEIFSGKQIPINTVDMAGNIMTTFYQVGTKITVTPRITKEDKIVMELRVERSGYIVGTAGYEITTRYASTTMAVDTGDALVIGGLVTNEQQETEYGVPILSSIPLLGELFKYKKKTTTTSVITILITPEIV